MTDFENDLAHCLDRMKKEKLFKMEIRKAPGIFVIEIKDQNEEKHLYYYKDTTGEEI